MEYLDLLIFIQTLKRRIRLSNETGEDMAWTKWRQSCHLKRIKREVPFDSVPNPHPHHSR